MDVLDGEQNYCEGDEPLPKTDKPRAKNRGRLPLGLDVRAPEGRCPLPDRRCSWSADRLGGRELTSRPYLLTGIELACDDGIIGTKSCDASHYVQ